MHAHHNFVRMWTRTHSHAHTGRRHLPARGGRGRGRARHALGARQRAPVDAGGGTHIHIHTPVSFIDRFHRPITTINPIPTHPATTTTIADRRQRRRPAHCPRRNHLRPHAGVALLVGPPPARGGRRQHHAAAAECRGFDPRAVGALSARGHGPGAALPRGGGGAGEHSRAGQGRVGRSRCWMSWVGGWMDAADGMPHLTTHTNTTDTDDDDTGGLGGAAPPRARRGAGGRGRGDAADGGPRLPLRALRRPRHQLPPAPLHAPLPRRGAAGGAARRPPRVPPRPKDLRHRGRGRGRGWGRGALSVFELWRLQPHDPSHLDTAACPAAGAGTGRLAPWWRGGCWGGERMGALAAVLSVGGV